MPYIKDHFFNTISPLADIVQLSSTSHAELEQDFETKYANTKAIYHYRDPGSFFGHLDEEFFKRVPESCKVVSHCQSIIPLLASACGGQRWSQVKVLQDWVAGKGSADNQWVRGMMISMWPLQRSTESLYVLPPFSFTETPCPEMQHPSPSPSYSPIVRSSRLGVIQY